MSVSSWGSTPAETYSRLGYGGRSGPLTYMLLGGVLHVFSLYVFGLFSYDGSGYQATPGGFVGVVGALVGGSILLVGIIGAGVRLGTRSR